MKTRLLFASAMALFMASCAQTELDQLSQTPTTKEEGKGIKFVASIEGSTNTRAALSPYEKVFNVNWYADKDKIGVFYKSDAPISVIDGQGSEGIGGETTWNGLQPDGAGGEAHPFAFKASASGTVGYFVAADDNNTLWLSREVTTGSEPIFRAFWPLADGDYATSAKVTLPSLATQDQKTLKGYGIVDKSFMISESTFDGEYDKNDNSVSKDRFSLKFTRVNPILYFKVLTGSTTVDNAKYNETYPEGFERYGKLQEVKLTAGGNLKESKDASILTFNSTATWDMAATDLAKGLDNSGDLGATSITTQLAGGAGFDWSNDATAFMVIANVDRVAGGFTEKIQETMAATYKFANVELEKSWPKYKNWEGNVWYGFPTQSGYNLDDENYNVYKVGSDYVLEINKDFTLADAFDENGVIGVKQNGGDYITKADIKHFVSKVDLTDEADFEFIKSLTGLTHVTLLENAEIPAEAFSGLSSLVYLNLPKVKTVADVNAFTGAAYKEVYMGAYDFSDVAGTNQLAVRNAVLKKASLEKADVSGVTTIGTLFIQNQYPSFDGFTHLKEITVKSDVEIATAGFKGCTSLTKVGFSVLGGSVKLNESSNSQFAGSTALTTINISNTKIPEAAFSGCSDLENVMDAAGQAIVPISIGESAFAGTALVNMDLSKATTIDKSAFQGCTALKGVLEGSIYVLYVNAVTHVSDYAFKGCTALKNISFAAATTIGVNILEGVTPDKIEFKKAFTVNSTEATSAGTKFFGTTTDAALYCNKGQTGVTFPVGGKPKITLTGNVDGSIAVETEFNIIDKKYE